MLLITKSQTAKMIKNGKIQNDLIKQEREINLKPVVKLFRGDGRCKFLLTELDPDDPDIAFGLGDLGFGCPELGHMRISDIKKLGLGPAFPIERDKFFKARKTINEYAEDARQKRFIDA